MARVLTPDQFKRDLAKQIRAFGPTQRRRFLRKVGGQCMTNMVLTRFARGGYETKGDWKSTSKGATKLNGRWSERYNVRPSGETITADKIRNVDTTDLANSYRILDADENAVTVGPGKTSHGGAGPLIAEREEKGGNHIVGFTREINDALAHETQWYLDRVAEGKEPPYLPKSTLGRKRVQI